ncbi:HET-domain-containing protein [Sordaria brevicollis]|uniref:HET-domain-containing protein n=1 Tax=Sordaria brevicollis TaxID=83679 RepID=A0AAE0PLQ6_SORBR|nr:HET-domain-containing protein [Sordaria brevicollis]
MPISRQKCRNCRDLQFPAIGQLPCPLRELVEASAAQGCRYCKLLIQVEDHFASAGDDENRSSAFFLRRVQGKEADYRVAHSGRFRRSIGQEDCVIQFFTPEGVYITGLPPAWPGIPQDVSRLDPQLLESPQTPEAYEFIRSCLRECDAKHPGCKPSSQEMPTRLLDVGHEDKGGGQIRLVESTSLPVGHTETYVALSYCWGKGKTLKLVANNMDAMKMGLPVSSLPKTLQDAVTVTRSLNQRYLWIDALCIIQDSRADWEVESSRMASVYRNAYVTVIAATAADVSEGFLSRHYPTTNTWYKEPSTRNGHRRCQCGKDVDETAALDEPDHSDAPLSTDPNTIAAKEFKEWATTVEEYSSRLLTVSLDKLPALSGLASVSQQRTNSQYIAGLWKDNLPLDILWQNLDDYDDASLTYAPEDYIAPSFSWASITAKVSFMDEVLLEDMIWQSVVEDASSTPEGKDPFGRVKDGWLQVRGYMPTATLHAVENSDGNFWYEVEFEDSPFDEEDANKFQLIPDTVLEEFDATDEHGNIERSVRRLRSPTTCTSPTTKIDHSLLFRTVFDTPVHLLFVAYRTQWNDSKGEFLFLVLGLSADKPGRYERLGIATCSFDFGVIGTDSEGYLAFLRSRAGEEKSIIIV